MTKARNNAAKTRGRPFQPGNPGRPKGARHRITLAIEALLEGEHEALTRKAIEKALEGDTVALRLCLDRLAPPRKETPISFALPAIRTAADAIEAGSAVLAAVAQSEITIDEAGRVMALLTAHNTMVTAGELEERIAVLEQRAARKEAKA